MDLPPLGPVAGNETSSLRQQALKEAARELEASFLAEMLEAAGVGETPGMMGGGIGESQFASFMRMEQARQMTERGGIGLADALYHRMKEHLND